MKYYAASDIGNVRSINEDSIFASDKEVGSLPNLYIVADGMGGHKAGEFASFYGIKAAVKSMGANIKINPMSIIGDGIRVANEFVFLKSNQNKNYSGMGTTFVLATIIGNKLYVANIGDSRLYVIRNKMIQITRDHSLVQELIDEGALEKGSEEYFRQRNIITKALGSSSSVSPDFFEVTLKKGDIILLCSDGLTTMVEDHDIFNIINDRNNLEDMVKALVSKSKKNGGYDNISVIIIDPEFER